MPVESLQERTVEVQVPPGAVDEELLSLYFENKKRSGGGSLESVERKGPCAVLVFEEAEAAARVLSKGHHVLHNVELSVRRPAPKDPHRLLLRGVNPNTSSEMLELYVENMMGLNVQDYNLQPSPGGDLILIHLNQPFSKDFQKMSTSISRRTLDGAQVTLEQIEQTDSILVENLHPGTNPDLLSLHFESGSRGGGQEVKEVTMLSESTAKVSFAKYESVAPVLNLPHNLDTADLVVKPYFDFLQPTEQPTSQLRTPERRDLTETDSENDVQMQTSPPIVAAPRATFQAASEPLIVREAVEEVAEAVMKDQSEEEEEEEETLVGHVALADHVKKALFQLGTFHRDLSKANPNFTIQLKDDGVNIAGPDRLKLDELKRTISDYIGNMAEVSFTLEPEGAELLARRDVKERLMGMVNESGPSTLYAALDSNVVVTSLSRDAAQQACSFLQSQVVRSSMQVDSEHDALLHCQEWSDFVRALSFCSIKASGRGGDIEVWTLKGMEDEKRAAIRQFLATPIEREAVIRMEPGMLKYIQIHCHQLLLEMDQVYIFPLEAEDVCGLKIHGPAVACQMAEELLQSVISSVCTKTIVVEAPGVCRFLDDPDCRSILNEMEAKFQVYISLKHVSWEPLCYEDLFEFAWKLMSKKNLPKMSEDGPVQELKAHSEQIDLYGASVKDLLDEAKMIVSTVDRGLQGDAASPRRPGDADNVDQHSSDEPRSLTESDAFTMEPSEPPADRDVAGGAVGFSPDLDEEAQLSLAIQYSMESSQWSEADEDAQLQKALELSKSMVQLADPPGGAEASPQVGHPQTSIRHMAMEDALEAISVVQLDVIAGYPMDLSRVHIAFTKRVTQRQTEEKVEHSGVPYMSQYHRTCLEVIKRKHGVQIQVMGFIITVSGFQDFVAGGIADVRNLLERMGNSPSDQEILKTVRWARHDPASTSATPYSADVTVFMENAFRRNLEEKKVEMLLDNQPHVISFEKMKECNLATGKFTNISRKLLNIDLNEEVPEEEYSLLSNMPEATRVHEESDEFQTVVKNFYSSIQEYHSRIRIIQLEKLTNRLLYNQYKLKKASVLQRAVYPEIERTLFHGTSETSVKEICIHGFNRSFCGKNATVYGQGVYFAVRSSLSVQDMYSPPNAEGYKYVFVSKVLTGDYTKGCSSMKTPPPKETGDMPLRYDSVTDDITKPSMFVIFNDTQAYPEYLITCQKVYR